MKNSDYIKPSLSALENKIRELENDRLCLRTLEDDMAEEEIKAYIIEQKSLKQKNNNHDYDNFKIISIGEALKKIVVSGF